MKNAHHTPKDEAGAPGKGTAIVTRPAKSGNSAGEHADLVNVERGQPVTTTERVAAAAGLQHASVIRLVREHLADFEEFGPIRFQIRMGTRGGVPVEYAELNEQQAALLFLYQRNTAKVRAFKLRMVKDFARATSELQRLKAMQAAPAWQAARVETKRDFCNVADMLQEVRADAGKDTKPHIFINESKLLRFAMTGNESAKWDRDTLSRDDLKLLGKVERLDMRLIAREMTFHDRKASCRALVLEARGLLLRGGRMTADNDHPDAWAPGLRLRLKALNVKTVTRAADPGEVLPVCLSHNLRTGNEGHRHRSRIDPARTGANEALRGPACPLVAAELVRSVLEELGIAPARRDTIMGVEAVIQAPEGSDTPAFWSECLRWVDGRYQHIVSAVVHRDQSRPHLHVIALAVAGGKLAGNALTSGAGRFTSQRREFLAHMRDRLGLRPDRPVKTLAALALTTGKGAKTRAAAARRDAELARKAGADWKRETVGMGVDGHGGSSLETGNPHAHEKGQPPLLRSVSLTQATPENGPQTPVFEATPATPMTPCPKPPQAPRSTAERLAHLGVLFARCRAPMSPCPAPVH